MSPSTPETPQEWFERTSAAIAADGYRESDYSEWDVFPWERDWAVKPLQPIADEIPRNGLGGVDCFSCATSAAIADGSLDNPHVVWTDDLFHLSWARETSLPFAAFLMPRRHADLATLTAEEAARQGELLAAIERAAMATTSAPRIQVARWGDGGEHLHWWLYARPAGANQLRGSFLMMWDDLLPLRPAEDVLEDARRFAEALVAEAGGRTLG